MKNNVLYWSITGLFAGFMAFTGVSDVMVTKGAIKMIGGLDIPII